MRRYYLTGMQSQTIPHAGGGGRRCQEETSEQQETLKHFGQHQVWGPLSPLRVYGNRKVN